MGLQGLENAKKVAYFEYDFAKEGGAVGDITLRGAKLPLGAIITDTHVHVITALTSGGSATVALKVLATADAMAATAVASLSLNALLDGKQKGAAANMIRCTSAVGLIATVAVDTLLTGKFVVALEYILTV